MKKCSAFLSSFDCFWALLSREFYPILRIELFSALESYVQGLQRRSENSVFSLVLCLFDPFFSIGNSFSQDFDLKSCKIQLSTLFSVSWNTRFEANKSRSHYNKSTLSWSWPWSTEESICEGPLFLCNASTIIDWGNSKLDMVFIKM